MTLIPDLLWTRAWRLAEAHNHEWMIALYSVTRGGSSPPRPVSIDMLDAIYRQFRDEWDQPSGVAPPFARVHVGVNDDRGNYSYWHYGAYHRTGTGRCRWHIDHDGEVTISISRPGDVDVLVVTVAVDGTVQWTAPACGVRYGVRHVEAAVYELTALGVDASVPPAIAEAAAFADRELTALDHTLAQIDHWEDRAERFE